MIGKGFTASTDIDKGTLLMISKAFACTYPDECDFLVLASNVLTEKADLTTSFFNKMHVVQTLQRSPQRAKELYSLYARDLPREHPIPDANAYRAFYGDVMMVHAIGQLKKGEEVSITYVDPQLSYKKRAEPLSSFGFECQCELCILDRSDELYDHQEKLVEQLTFLKPLLDVDPRKRLIQLNPLVEELRQTFHQRKTLRLQLLKPLTMLSAAYRRLDKFDASNKVSFDLLDCLNESLLCQFGAEFYVPIRDAF